VELRIVTSTYLESYFGCPTSWLSFANRLWSKENFFILLEPRMRRLG
jgi:hypothetical protein